ncbi:hypothetical protein Vretimale_5941 [Volvox reticuliferus]|uniref:Pherophorin domain-containing protein n=1 Tax=Volvox reticuliferus TaxID=1737510 RepID=A0A8J4LK42_9CHLO|nr:hypothetical protein Vretimale_5941 [Volvox reticuliferus]
MRSRCMMRRGLRLWWRHVVPSQSPQRWPNSTVLCKSYTCCWLLLVLLVMTATTLLVPGGAQDIQDNPQACNYLKSAFVFANKSDINLGAVYPLMSIAAYGDEVLEFAQSVYNCGNNIGPLHGGISKPSDRPYTVVDLSGQWTDPNMRIKFINVCCRGLIPGANPLYSGVQQITITTANNTVLRLGAAACARDTYGFTYDNSFKYYYLAGLVSWSLANGSSAWVHRVGFYMLTYPTVPTCTAPMIPSPPSPPTPPSPPGPPPTPPRPPPPSPPHPPLAASEVYVSPFFCGFPTGIKYSTKSDVRLGIQFPVHTLSGFAGWVLDFAVSSYNCGQQRGPLHGGLSGIPYTSLDLRSQLSDPNMRITQVSVCCSGNSWGNGTQRLMMRTANGTLFSFGGLCTRQQPWLRLPANFTFAGVVTQSPADGSNRWIHRLAFVAIRYPPGGVGPAALCPLSAPSSQPLPPSTPPSSDIYISPMFCGQDFGVKYATSSDANLASTFPIQTLNGRAGWVLEFAMSMYDCNGQYQGATHGGYATNSTTVVLDLSSQLSDHSSSRLLITKFTTCCAGKNSTWANAAQRIVMLRADGTQLNIGKWCTVPQPWIDVPPGYTFGGLVTQSPAAADERSNWVHRLGFVAVRYRPEVKVCT